MLFAFPVALFPAMAASWGGAEAAGMLFSAMAIGSLVATVFSGWTSGVTRHGRAVVIAAALWGVFIVFVGLFAALTAPAGAALAHRLDQKTLKYVFAVFLVVVGLNMIWKALA